MRLNVNKIVRENNFIFIIAICICAAALMGLFKVSSISRDNNDSIIYDTNLISFDRGWQVQINDGKQETTQLPYYVNSLKNDVVSIKNYLPAALTDGTYIAFKSSNAFIKVFVENELIFENKNFITHNETSQPLSSWNFVSLSKDYQGSEITVILQSPYSYYSGIIPEIIMGTHSETLLYASSETASDLRLGFSIVILGLLMFLFSITSFTNEKDSQALIYLGINIAMLGLMLISGICDPHTGSRSYFIDYLMMNFCLRILPMTYSFYQFLRGDISLKKVYVVVFCIALLNFVVSTGLYILSVSDFTETVHISYVIMLLIFALALYHDLRNKNSIRYKILIGLGLGSFIMLTSVEVFTHIIYIYRFPVSPTIVGALIFALMQMTAVLISAHDRTIKQLVIQKEYNDSKIKLLISQIQPHFIYNSLTTIRVMIKFDPDKAYKMIKDFSSYLSYNFNSLEDIPLVPFSEELKHIKTYTAIELERFYNRLNVIYDTESENFTVPPLSVQPYVENAIKHGVCKRVDGGTVIIKSYSTSENWVIKIIDDGIGFDLSEILKKKRSVGIKNARYRLSILSQAEIDISSEIGKGTTVTILIPKQGRRSENEDHSS